MKTRIRHQVSGIKYQVLCYLLLTTCYLLPAHAQNACNCNQNDLAFLQTYVDAHPFIFRGKTISINKGTDYDRVDFLISSLFKGTASKQITVYYDTKNACALKFNAGEDWLVYAERKQGKPFVAYCSRSRKNVINTNKNVDLMYIKSDLTVDDETEKLTELCGLKQFAGNQNMNQGAPTNIIPNGWQRIVLILVSLVGFAVIYILVNRLFKKQA